MRHTPARQVWVQLYNHLLHESKRRTMKTSKKKWQRKTKHWQMHGESTKLVRSTQNAQCFQKLGVGQQEKGEERTKNHTTQPPPNDNFQQFQLDRHTPSSTCKRMHALTSCGVHENKKQQEVLQREVVTCNHTHSKIQVICDGSHQLITEIIMPTNQNPFG